MTNPNAVAAWLATHAVIGAEQLLSRYAHWQLPGYWATELTADVGTVVLFVGRNGLKAGLSRAWATVKRAWSGPAAAAK